MIPAPSADLHSLPVYALTVLPDRLAVCRCASDTPLPAWAGRSNLWAAIRTPDELCVVCAEEVVPDGITAERGWKVFQVIGPLDFSLVGVLSSLASSLASAGISLFALSTYDTDYILVREAQLHEAVAALRKDGHHVDWQAGIGS